MFRIVIYYFLAQCRAMYIDMQVVPAAVCLLFARRALEKRLWGLTVTCVSRNPAMLADGVELARTDRMIE